ncbi:MAG: YceI family protein, partial [Saprospiraceae bacterium]
PKAIFKGEITNLSDVNFKKDGTYKVKVKGTMDMHGVKKETTSDGTLTVAGKNVKVNSDFIIKPADYDIKIPSVVADKIAKEVKVKFTAELQALAGK